MPLPRSFGWAMILAPFFALSAQAQLRVVTYNTAMDARTGIEDVFEAIGDEVVNGISKPIDVLSLQEQASPMTTTRELVDLLNSVYGAGTYDYGRVRPSSNGNGGPGLIYNTQTVELLDEERFGTLSANSQARQFMRYTLKPVGYTADDVFYVYSNHYKASSGSSNEARREIEANLVRSTADSLGQGAHIIYTGDFNIYDSDEASYQTLLSSGNGQAFDPVNSPYWGGSFYRHLHTQAPSSSPPGGLVGGGMDDRFDFQLVTGEWLDGSGFEYIEGSYHAFGNNGTHTYNSSITTGHGASSQILYRLTQVSDHIPVVADYQLPALADFSYELSSDRVIVGSAVSASAQVENTAGDTPVVSFANGADDLDYTLEAAGQVFTGSAEAFSTPDTYAFSIDTQTPGQYNVGAHLTASGIEPIDVSEQLTVLDHARPSLLPGQEQVKVFSIDFGVLDTQASTIDLPFGLYNLPSASFYTAALDLDLIEKAGSDLVSLTLDTFSGLQPAGNHPFTISVDRSATGLLDVTYTFTTSDEDIPGEASEVLTLTLLGTVASMPGDFNGSDALDSDDLDRLVRRFGQSTTGYDLDGDGSIDEGDVDYWLGSLAGTVRGDANLDRSVDLLDLSSLASHFEQAGSWAEGDFNGDGMIDLLDLSILASQFGFEGSVVPAPSSMTALLLGVGLIRRRSVRGAC